MNKLPPKVISTVINEEFGLAFWPHKEGQNDPWYKDGIQPRDYRWVVEMSVSPQLHSSHLTRKAFQYNGMDINVGDWIANIRTGEAFKIISIEAKNDSFVRAIIEDISRYNTFKDPSQAGTGNLETGNAVVFEITDEGNPILDPVPPEGVSLSFYSNLKGRFEKNNPQFSFNLTEPNHSFQKGDVVAVDPQNNSFVKSSNVYQSVIGRVTELGPEPDQFFINPVQKVTDNLSHLPGNVGDTIFAGNQGSLTTTDTGKAIYIKLRNSTQSKIRSTKEDATTTVGNIIQINGVSRTITTPGDLDSIASDINAISGSTNITATVVPSPVTVKTTLSLFYGEPALYTDNPASATIDGVTVTFDIDTEGQKTYGFGIALEQDMAAAINRDMSAAGNNTVEAFAESNKLAITKLDGNAFTIINGDNDTNGIAFSGINSGSGLEQNISSSSGELLELAAPDAREIDILDIQGSFTSDIGIWSVENGTKAAALYIEQGLRKGEFFVVNDIPARDSLSPLVGDMAYVIDSGNLESEWGLYLWDGSAWIIIATQDSAKTDSNSYSLVIDHNKTTGNHPIGVLSDTSRVTLITVEVTQPFNGSATLSLGDSGDNERLMTASQIDLTEQGTYLTSSSYQYTLGSDVEVNAYFDLGGATQGSARIVLSYQ